MNTNTIHPKSNIWPPPMPWRFKLRGIFFGWCILASSIVGVPLIYLPFIIFVRPFFPSLWRKFYQPICSSWFNAYLYFFENINGYEFNVTGDEIPKDEFCLAVSNHPSEADWLYYWSIVKRYHKTEHHKIILKDVMRKAFGVGWAIDFMEFIFLARDWKLDKSQIVYNCKQYLESGDSLFVLLFPEGTDFSPAKHERSQKYAQQIGISGYKHLLVPRTKGFVTVANQLRPKLDAVYDLTIAYDNGEITPTILSAWCGWYPHKIHIHIRRFPINQIPSDKKLLSDWCLDDFREKDKLLEHFQKHKQFPNPKIAWTQLDNTFYSFVLWFLLTLFMVYITFSSRYVLAAEVIGWIFCIINSFSLKFRRILKLSPPTNYLDLQKKID